MLDESKTSFEELKTERSEDDAKVAASVAPNEAESVEAMQIEVAPSIDGSVKDATAPTPTATADTPPASCTCDSDLQLVEEASGLEIVLNGAFEEVEARVIVAIVRRRSSAKPTAENEQRATENKQRATGNEQRATENEQRATEEKIKAIEQPPAVSQEAEDRFEQAKSDAAVSRAPETAAAASDSAKKTKTRAVAPEQPTSTTPPTFTDEQQSLPAPNEPEHVEAASPKLEPRAAELQAEPIDPQQPIKTKAAEDAKTADETKSEATCSLEFCRDPLSCGLEIVLAGNFEEIEGHVSAVSQRRPSLKSSPAATPTEEIAAVVAEKSGESEAVSQPTQVADAPIAAAQQAKLPEKSVKHDAAFNRKPASESILCLLNEISNRSLAATIKAPTPRRASLKQKEMAHQLAAEPAAAAAPTAAAPASKLDEALAVASSSVDQQTAKVSATEKQASATAVKLADLPEKSVKRDATLTKKPAAGVRISGSLAEVLMAKISLNVKTVARRTSIKASQQATSILTPSEEKNAERSPSRQQNGRR